MTYFLEGPRVGLRALEPRDALGEYPGWLNDAEVCKLNAHHVYPYSSAQAEEFIRATYGDRTRVVLAVEDKESRQHIGNLALQSINFVDRNAEFAILMGNKSFWGKGLAKEASTLLVRHGFVALNLHRIYCGTQENHSGMKKLAEALFMKSEGVCRQARFKDGAYRDICLYAVLASDFPL